MFYCDEVLFTLSDHVNCQHNRYWSRENHLAVHEVPLHVSKVLVWCAIHARRINEPMFLHKTINSECYVKLILPVFFNQLTKEEISQGHFMQDNAWHIL
jgi:hypothetical protein